MEYVYATLTLHETGAEINEDNLTAVLEAAGAEVEDSRVKAIVAALEDVDLADVTASATIAASATEDPSEGQAASEPDEDDEAADGGPFAELEYPRTGSESDDTVPDEAEDR